MIEIADKYNLKVIYESKSLYSTFTSFKVCGEQKDVYKLINDMNKKGINAMVIVECNKSEKRLSYCFNLSSEYVKKFLEE